MQSALRESMCLMTDGSECLMTDGSECLMTDGCVCLMTNGCVCLMTNGCVCLMTDGSLCLMTDGSVCMQARDPGGVPDTRFQRRYGRCTALGQIWSGCLCPQHRDCSWSSGQHTYEVMPEGMSSRMMCCTLMLDGQYTLWMVRLISTHDNVTLMHTMT